ncbi:flagellar biosynthesis protein FlgL [Bradyrhizobium sp.]|jgi:flagellar hook-associated protein 3 FlgL|uniref:flagellar biosynthesis protein FlgL n=1 Tax=Bradyrhizobium sp. TaxID=376 RepID=UPI003C74CEAD
MAINSVGIGTSILNQSVVDLKNQLTELQSQLTTGKKSTSYAGMGVNEGFAIAARAQLASISAFSDTMSNINTNIGVANTALQSMVDIGTTVLNSANSSSPALNSAGQTIGQQTATSQLSSMLGILNTQAGDRYLFSGSAINTPSVASMDDILNGTATQAGLKQVISERQQADLGTSGLGRLIISSPTPTSVQVAEDVAGSPFGFKLNAISSSLTGSIVTGPTGSPSAVSVDLGVTNPSNGDKVSFKFNLPDGTTETIQLTASSATPPPAGSFAIGATPAATAANLNAALNTAIGTLANTSLVAASAIAAGNDFFGAPPQRVGTTPLGSATTLVNGTANTVSWYTGEAGPGAARATATARVDQSVTVQYGARANESAIRLQLQTLAVFSAVTTSTANPNAGAQVAALSQRVAQNLTPQPGQQTIEDIQSDFATAQMTMKDATSRQKQTQGMLQGIVDQAENVAPDQVASEILALQTALQASYQTTSMLSQLTLTKYLPIG